MKERKKTKKELGTRYPDLLLVILKELKEPKSAAQLADLASNRYGSIWPTKRAQSSVSRLKDEGETFLKLTGGKDDHTVLYQWVAPGTTPKPVPPKQEPEPKGIRDMTYQGKQTKSASSQLTKQGDSIKLDTKPAPAKDDSFDEVMNDITRIIRFYNKPLSASQIIEKFKDAGKSTTPKEIHTLMERIAREKPTKFEFHSDPTIKAL